ncbi:MAG: hypothetical protein KDA80_17270, partial [Planctomycetaceae bacterium]|nr:hypothetical protein [Planctomycetaceae bacterium]
MGVKTSSQSAHSQSKPVATERTPRLFEECARLTDSCQDRNLLLSRIATLLSQRGLADFLILVRRENSGKWIAEGLLHPAEKSGEEFLETMMNLAEKAVLEKRSIEIQEGRTSGFRLAATPIPAHPRAEEALVAILGRPLPQTVGMIPPLETVAAAISRWDAWKAFQLSDDLAENAFAVVELVARAQAASDEQSTALKVVQQLAEFLDTSHCAIVKTPPQGAPELLACADDTIASNDGEQSQFISHAGLEATLQGGVLTWHASEGTSAAGMLPLRRLAMATHAASVVAIPLTNQEGRSYGAFVFWGDASLLEPRDAIRFLSAAAEPVTELLMAKQRAAGGWLRRLVDQLESGWKSSRRSLLIGAIGMLTLMLMIPCPYWVACDCEVQPVHRRFLAAPFDSKLQESFVEPGDV